MHRRTLAEGLAEDQQLRRDRRAALLAWRTRASYTGVCGMVAGLCALCLPAYRGLFPDAWFLPLEIFFGVVAAVLLVVGDLIWRWAGKGLSLDYRDPRLSDSDPPP